MALTQSQKIAVRRHLGIPFAGTAQAGRLFGWRWMDHVEDLEYRMNNMQPSEEQLLTGNSMGSFALTGVPTPGDVVTYTLTPPSPASPIVVHYTVTSNDLKFVPPGSSLVAPTFSIALNSVVALTPAIGPAGFQAVGVQPSDLISPPFMPPYFAEILITGPSSSLFSLAVSVAGTTIGGIDLAPTVSPVTATLGPAGSQTILFGYLSICDFLAMQPATALLSLRYDTADVVKFRRDEVAAFAQQYRYYCKQLAHVMGGEQYINYFFGGGRGGHGGGSA